MTRREPLMDQAYFDGAVDYETKTLARFEEKLATSPAPPANRARWAYSIFQKRYELILLRYSCGEPVSEIGTAFPSCVEAWERYLGMEGHQSVSFADSLDDYVVSLWLVFLAMLFDADAAILDRLLRCIGNAGTDALFERIVATRVSNRPQAQRLLWPKPYQLLQDAIDAPPATRPHLFQKFLKIWYPSLIQCYWHDNHKGPEGGGFFGYWCLEAAGVVKAFGINDSAFCDMSYYPKDFLHGM